jgi:8-hydroxy-5-deazaflavin:NADPH oxidoreductase
MKISILGTGRVGQTIAVKMTALGHQVFLGSRNSKKTMQRENSISGKDVSFAEWLKTNSSITLVDYQEIPADTIIFINCTQGEGSIPSLKAVGKDKLNGKVILDIANPLDFSKGMPPSLYICNTDSLAEKIQDKFPESNVVKGLNTMNCNVMMNPSMVPGDHNVFLSGNDSDAKKIIVDLLVSIGWKSDNVIDLGDITTARGSEMILPIWLRLWGVLRTPDFNFHIAKK